MLSHTFVRIRIDFLKQLTDHRNITIDISVLLYFLLVMQKIRIGYSETKCQITVVPRAKKKALVSFREFIRSRI